MSDALDVTPEDYARARKGRPIADCSEIDNLSMRQQTALVLGPWSWSVPEETQKNKCNHENTKATKEHEEERIFSYSSPYLRMRT